MSKKLIVNGAFVDKSNNISPENSVMVNFPGNGESASATTLSAGNVEFKLNDKVSVGSKRIPVYIENGMAYEATAGVGDKNVQADWSTTNSNSDSFIKNKPTIPTAESLKEDLKNVLSGDFLPLSGGSVSGTVEATSIYESSDVELKENIGLVSTTDIEKVTNVEFKEYNFKDDSKQTKKYGVIAQEVEEAGLENLVKVNNDGLRSVDYISLLCLKMEAMQKEMEALKSELKELKGGK